MFINSNNGVRRFFKSQAFHYQVLRTMGHQLGANPGECLAAIAGIRDGDAESWYASWDAMGRFCEDAAKHALDSITQGKAYLRACNYYRNSEFFLQPPDQRKMSTYDKSAAMFVKGISALGIAHEVWAIPYEDARMRVYYFPGQADKPLIMICGGYDSTNEESFFWIGHGVIERGYPCIMFEGPGQSNLIRQYDMKFTPEWEKPVKAVLDYAENKQPELIFRKKVLYGISLGGRLVPRAAAYEKRIDAVVIQGGAAYDAHRAALNLMPLLARIIYHLGLRYLFNILAGFKAKCDIGLRWAINNGCWTIGVASAFDLVKIFRSYSLDDYIEKITCDVLIMNGECEHFYNPESDSAPFKNRLTCARSFTHHLFRGQEGAAAHCQAGALEQAEQVFFDWVGLIFQLHRASQV